MDVEKIEDSSQHGQNDDNDSSATATTTTAEPEPSGIESVVFLLDGYLRRFYQQPLATPLKELILSFMQRMSGSSFVWNITDRRGLLSSMLNANYIYSSNKGFESDVFEICPQIHLENTATTTTTTTTAAASLAHSFEQDLRANLKFKFYLKIYPNGANAERNGEFQIELCLVSLPSILCRLLFVYSVYCHQLCSNWCSLLEFKSSSATTKFITDDGSYGYNDDDADESDDDDDGVDTNGDGMNGGSAGGGGGNIILNDLRVLHELHRLPELTFYCTLSVIRVGFALPGSVSLKRGHGRDKKNICYCYNPLYLEHDNTTSNTSSSGGRHGDDDTHNAFMMKQSSFEFTWHLHRFFLDALATSKPGKTLKSDIFHHMWSVTVSHKKLPAAAIPAKPSSASSSAMNGHDHHTRRTRNKGILTIGIMLCSLPSNISSLIAQIKIHCVQHGSSDSQIKKFDYKTFEYAQLFETSISVQELTQRFPSKLSIACEIHVIEAFDESGKEMSLVHRQRQQQQQQQQLSSSSMMGMMMMGGAGAGAGLYGTHGHMFVPQMVANAKNEKVFHYQHICVSNETRLDEKCAEELRFEDQYSQPSTAQVGMLAPPPPPPRQVMMNTQNALRKFQNWRQKKQQQSSSSMVMMKNRTKRDKSSVSREEEDSQRVIQNLENEVQQLTMKMNAVSDKLRRRKNVVFGDDDDKGGDGDADDDEDAKTAEQIGGNVNGNVDVGAEQLLGELIDVVKRRRFKQKTEVKKAKKCGKESVKDWLEKTVRLKEYYALFMKQGLESFDVIRQLNLDMLQQIGIRKLGHRIQIMQAIEKLTCKECGKAF